MCSFAECPATWDWPQASETAIGNAIRRRAASEDPDEVRRESRRVRLKLETQHAGRSAKEIDIKFGAGGLLDVYFVVRYLYLRDKIANGSSNRSTAAKLDEFFADGTLSAAEYQSLSEGYAFLSEMDHNIRLMVGRVSRLPRANNAALERIAARMNAASPAELLERLTLHRLNIRAAFEQILAD